MTNRTTIAAIEAPILPGLGMAPLPAEATFPGANGRIVTGWRTVLATMSSSFAPPNVDDTARDLVGSLGPVPHLHAGRCSAVEA